MAGGGSIRRKRAASSDTGEPAGGERAARPRLKRQKRRIQVNSDDLLVVLDDGYAMEHAADNDGGDYDCGGLTDDTGDDIRAIAAVVLRSLQRANSSARGTEPDPTDTTTEADGDSADDLLQHLDAAFQREGGATAPDGVSDPLALDDGGTQQLDIRAIAAFAMGVVNSKYRVGSASSQTLCSIREAGTCSNALLQASETLARRNRLYMRRYRKRLAATRQAPVPTSVGLAPLSKEIRADALKRLQEALGPESLDECVCVSCDRLVRGKEATRKEASDWYMSKMRRCFGEPDATLPSALRRRYSAPACVTVLADTLVSPRSFRCYNDNSGHPTAWFSVCKACNTSIEQGRLPRFSISNGFCIGSLPDNHAQGLTLPERLMTQLVSIAATTRDICGGRHRCIRSHCIVFDCTPSPPVSLLPRSISEVSTFRVAIVGDFTEEQTDKIRKMHQFRARRVQDVFDFYQINNCLYASVTPNDAVLNELARAHHVEQLISDDIEDGGGAIQNNISEDQENIRGHDGDWQVPREDDELAVVERRIGLSDASRMLLSQERNLPGESNGARAPADREFLVKRSSKLSMDISGDLLAEMFPHLFPYGHGHPGEIRHVPISLK